MLLVQASHETIYYRYIYLKNRRLLKKIKTYLTISKQGALRYP